MKADLTIYQGDDTNFNGSTTRWCLPQGYDYTGWMARYSIGPITKDVSIEQSEGQNYISFELSAEETSSIPAGKYFLALKLWDNTGKCQTVSVVPVVCILPMEVNNDGK